MITSTSVKGKLFECLTGLEWEDVDAVQAASRPPLARIGGDKQMLRRLVEGVMDDPTLLGMSEHYDILDKIVLYQDESDSFRIRLHLFQPGYFDRPHNHRWTYSSLILNGQYRHYLFGHDDKFDVSVNTADLKPLMVRTETVGSTYTLHHTMIHSTVAEPYTCTIVARGPAMKEKFLVTDRKTGKVWWQYGAQRETREEKNLKAMSPRRLENIASTLGRLGLI